MLSRSKMKIQLCLLAGFFLASLELAAQKRLQFLSHDFLFYADGWKQVPSYELNNKEILAEYFISQKGLNGSLTLRKLTKKKPQSFKTLRQDFYHSGFTVDSAKRVYKGIFLFELSHSLTNKKILQLSFSKKDQLIILTCKSHKDYFSKLRKFCFRTMNTFQWIPKKPRA